MGLFDWFRRHRTGDVHETRTAETVEFTQPTLEVRVTRPPQRLTPATLASELIREYPHQVPAEVLTARAQAAGFKPETIERLVARLTGEPTQPEPVRVRTISVEALRIVDLSGLDSVRMRVKGVGHSVTADERDLYGDREYLLVPEPDNPTDPSAVAVYGKGRRVGYVSTSRAATVAPLLAQIGADAYRVTGTGTTPSSSMLWVDIPRMDALRKFARTQR